MEIIYEAITQRVKPQTAEEQKAVKVLEYRELPEDDKTIREYAEIAARAYAKKALYVLILELKKYAFENHCKRLNVKIMVCSNDYIKASGNNVEACVDLTATKFMSGFITSTIQECIFRGIYGKCAKEAYMNQIHDSLKELGEPISAGDIHLYEDVTIVFCQ